MRAIVLAAGKGTRMKSARTKVLHEICGRPLLWYVLRALRAAGMEEILVVTNDEVQARIDEFGAAGVLQREQLGTGHAVKIALEALSPREGGKILVAPGDMPLVTEELFRSMQAALDDSTAMALVTARMGAGSNFGRIVRRGDLIARVVEVRDAAPEELAVDEMNAGIYAFAEDDLRSVVANLRPDNAQKEYYLTDAVAHLVDRGRNVRPIATDEPGQVLGINDRVELAIARKAMNARLCDAHMRAGVTIVDPETTYLEPELSIGRDTVIYPNTAISLLSTIGEGCVIGPGSRLSNARIGRAVTVRESVVVDSTIGDGTAVGPFAHVRGETVLGKNVRIGNFVEVKKSTLADGAKAAHLAYLGDSTVGEESNIGAGTITANFDGKNKNATTIGKDVRIGSNTSLIAPVTVGDGALTGAGAVVTKDVPPGERVAGNPARPLKRKNDS